MAKKKKDKKEEEFKGKIYGPASEKQKMILESDAAITVIGGAAGSGKSFLLQLMALRYVDDPNTRCIMFRRTTPQLTGQGGLYETAKGIYLDLPKKFRPVFKEKDLKAVFPSGASIKYSHMEYECSYLPVEILVE